ncbi:MAG: adenosine deaminase, partial [Micrococcales bacterium]
MKLTGKSLQSLPKISLHDHLDGGLRASTIIELAAGVPGLELPATSVDELDRWFVESADSGNLVDYLKTFDVTCAVMQTAANLERIAHEFVLDLAADGVIYGEIRWAPEQHLRGGLSLDEAVDAVQAGLESGCAAVAKTGR